jgi:5,10-methylenetetrahydrofolate reductase
MKHKTLKTLLQENIFVITAEIFPPKGTDVEDVFAKADLLKGVVNAVNITDNQRAVVRYSSLALCALLENRGIDTVYQLTVRDRNRLALQSDLLATREFGIKNIVALSGDLPLLGDHKEAKPVYDFDTIALIECVNKMNNGTDYNGHKLNRETDLFIGAVCNPGYEPRDLQIMTIEKKVKAGAKFFQTQAIYSAKDYEKFVSDTKFLNVKILAGILPLKSAKMARFMNANVPGINVPEHLIDLMEKAQNPVLEGIKITAELIKEIKSFADGIHVMAINFEEKIPDILKEAGLIS